MKAAQKETETEEKKAEINAGGKKHCKIIFFLALLVAVLCIAAFGYGYFRLASVNTNLAHRVTDLQAQDVTTKRDIASLQSDIQNVDAIAKKSQQISVEQERLVTEWRAAEKGDLNKWRVAEAAYLVRMANNQLKFANNSALALTLLQQADLSLQNVQNAENIRQALAENEAKLQAMPKVDVASLYIRLNALDKQIDNLSLITYPLKDTTHPAINQLVVEEPLPWWKAGLKNAWNSLSQLVIIRDTSKNSALPLVLPDEKMFLYQNLHAQFANAMWSVLHREQTVYDSSLTRITEWITQYFNSDLEPTKVMLQNIDELKKVDIVSPSTLDLSDTIARFDQYLNQTTAATPPLSSTQGGV